MNRSKIKLCHISEATSGGVLTHLNQLAEHLDSEVFEQYFLLSSLKGPWLQGQDHFHCHRLHVIDMVRNINPLKDLISLIQMVLWFRKNKFDLVHCHSSKAGVIGRLAAWITGHKKIIYTPHAFSFHDYQPSLKSKVFALIERLMGRLTTHIICVSEGEYSQVQRYGIVSRNKVSVIPNGIEINLPAELIREQVFSKYGLNKTDKIIAFIGRLSIQKNPSLIIKAMARVNCHDCILVLMGDGELKTSLMKLTDTLGIKENVLFLGEVSNVRSILRHCDLFISTSLWEGLPYSILEAMAEQVPVVATDILGHRDLVIHEETGILTNVGDVEKLASYINFLLMDQSIADNLAKKAYESLIPKYTITSMVNSLTNLYKKILS